jgi:hypothetical protein
VSGLLVANAWFRMASSCSQPSNGSGGTRSAQLTRPPGGFVLSSHIVIFDDTEASLAEARGNDMAHRGPFSAPAAGGS